MPPGGPALPATAPQPPAATIRDVAGLAGVSVAAVSRFVNRKQRFTPEVERRIEAAIAQVGYRSNPSARSMATGRSGAVAALVAGVANPHAAALVKGLCRVAIAERYDLLFVDLQASAQPRRALDQVLGMQVDGLILAASMPTGTAELLARYGRPFVDLTRRGEAPEPGEPPPALSPHQAAGALLGRYLLRTGHRRVAYIGCAAEAGSAERQQGLQQALAKAGLRLAVSLAPLPSAEGGAAIASGLLLGAQRPDAVVACNDQLAMGLVSEARMLGVDVPGEVSVAGIGNMPFAHYLSPALTSVDLHADTLGELAMRRLLAAIRNEPAPASLDLPAPRLVVRESIRLRSV